VIGLDGVIVEVEVDAGDSLPGITIAGLPGAAVQESRDRVLISVKNAGQSFLRRRMIVNQAPAPVHEELPLTTGRGRSPARA
jgi:magnesium chelatase family protein